MKNQSHFLAAVYAQLVCHGLVSYKMLWNYRFKGQRIQQSST